MKKESKIKEGDLVSFTDEWSEECTGVIIEIVYNRIKNHPYVSRSYKILGNSKYYYRFLEDIKKIQ